MTSNLVENSKLRSVPSSGQVDILVTFSRGLAANYSHSPVVVALAHHLLIFEELFKARATVKLLKTGLCLLVIERVSDDLHFVWCCGHI